MAAAAVATTYAVLEEEGIVEAVARRATEVVTRLESLRGRTSIREVRGLGYLLGVECDVDTKELRSKLRQEGVLVGASNHPQTFRLLPPLTVSDEEWNEFFSALEKALGG